MIAVQLIAAGMALAVPTAAEPREAPSQVSAPSKQRAPTRYCTIDIVTGSLIKRKTCHTRAEWMELGFDPLASK